MIRAYADHIATDTNEEMRIEIHDSEFSGTPIHLIGAPPFGLLQYESLNPRTVWSNPLQSGTLTLSVHIRNAAERALLTDILASDERRFTMVYKKGSDPYAPVDGNTFTWQGLEYTVIVKNGLAWLDRNLGATRAATASDDTQAYGDYYQWGRLTDGHEKIGSLTTSTLATSDVPNNDGKYILALDSPFDWRNPQNNNLWQGADGINNPAPPGWRIPTEAEWEIERASWDTNNMAGAFGSTLKLPAGGRRRSLNNGSYYNMGSFGYFWSSTVAGSLARLQHFYSSSASMLDNNRANGASVRCVRDLP